MNPFVDGLHQFVGYLIPESIEVGRSVRPLWQRQRLDHALAISCGGKLHGSPSDRHDRWRQSRSQRLHTREVSTLGSDEKFTQDCQLEVDTALLQLRLLSLLRLPSGLPDLQIGQDNRNPGDNQTCKLDGKENPIDPLTLEVNRHRHGALLRRSQFTGADLPIAERRSIRYGIEHNGRRHVAPVPREEP
jgi:hypothetical protein